jgi:hypothetical protein
MVIAYVSCDPERAELGPLIATDTSPKVVPVPVRVTVCGLSYASSLKFSVATRTPVAVGANVTCAVHDPDAAIVFPEQVSELVAKSPAFVPLIATELTAIDALPVSDRVTVFEVLVLPRGWFPKSSDAGLTVSGAV